MGPLYRNQKVIMVGGQGVEFHYSYDRYIHEVKEGSQQNLWVTSGSGSAPSV